MFYTPYSKTENLKYSGKGLIDMFYTPYSKTENLKYSGKTDPAEIERTYNIRIADLILLSLFIE